MKNLFVIKNIEFEKVSDYSSNYDLDRAAAEKEIENLPLPDAIACRNKIAKLDTPVYKNFHFAYQYCVFAKKDCGHVEILQTHFLDGLELMHKGKCTHCICNWDGRHEA